MYIIQDIVRPASFLAGCSVWHLIMHVRGDMGELIPCMQGTAFDLVVSGINRGDNCGLHVIYSGTVGAAREAACKVPLLTAAWLQTQLHNGNMLTLQLVVYTLLRIVLRAIKRLVFAFCTLCVNN